MVSDQARNEDMRPEKQKHKSLWPWMHIQVPWRHGNQKQCADLDKPGTYRLEEAMTETLRKLPGSTQRHRLREAGRRKERQIQGLKKGAQRLGDHVTQHCTEAFSAASGILVSQLCCCLSKSISLREATPSHTELQEERARRAFRKPLPNFLF